MSATTADVAGSSCSTSSGNRRPARRRRGEDQQEASPDYDCEAVFCAGEKVYLLTKHRSDKRTRLYRVEGESEKKSNPLRLVDSFEIGGMVTAADVSPDGKLVAVLTYTSLWVFEFDPASGSIFRRGMRWTPVLAWQAEAAAFHGNDEVVIANEGGQLYRVAVDSMEKVR
jgi:roadblock/LC7 domain-containing protein